MNKDKDNANVCLTVIQGGLGNQIFQLLTGIEYARTHMKKLCILTANNRRPYYWDTILSRYASIVIDQSDIPADTIIYMEPQYSYTPLPFIPGNVCLYGYFQSIKYFPSQIAAGALEARKALGLDDVSRLDENVVVVHARRGDYLQLADIHPVQSERYYSEGAMIMASIIGDPHFILLSDDMEYWPDRAPEIFKGHKYSIWSDSNEVNTLTMMVGASNFIIANSTYSWWGAVLSRARNVIAPEKWFCDGREANDMYLDHWVRL